ncbi:Zinc finger FYVE domain-containing protein 19 [Melipona quadrifasciata]|uniref:Zinc finger FYVE domain-containing protein 19 n=1 Tax=Melipona quadrifasciata TaxID=166423 RepID=A0A0M9ABR4_9HYME|nr:Zinc finger FYVE domain-containing protein 19 [Melipona quadrifasciata]
MSCSICQAKFSFFTREVACPGCGFSCCSKCLKYKYNIPDKGVKKICGRCFNKHNFTSKSSSNNSIEMDKHDKPMAEVDITKKLESLENPAKPPIIMYKHTNHWDRFKTGLEPADQEIVERLRKLKEEDKTTALSVDEIRRRLALLKDEDPDVRQRTINIHQVDTRTDQQKTDDLIQEYLKQLELSSSSDSVSEIQARLKSLQGISDKPREHSANDDDDDEKQVTKKLIAKALAEAELEKKYEENVDELEEMEIEEAKRTDDEDEEPSCVMCEQTEDLQRCISCHGDLYCPVCFEDNHDEFELKMHKKEPATKRNQR